MPHWIEERSSGWRAQEPHKDTGAITSYATYRKRSTPTRSEAEWEALMCGINKAWAKRLGILPRRKRNQNKEKRK